MSKPLNKQQIATLVARDIPRGAYVNLGIGQPTTVADHLRELPPSERDAYRALAREAARLADTRDHALDRLLADVQSADPAESGIDGDDEADEGDGSGGGV